MSIYETNFEEYEDPVMYDLENAPFLDDVEFLMKWADQVQGPIIDLACGTGRATIPLAQQGYSLIGVDLHEGMLEHAARKSERLKLPIQWVKQDCSRLALHQTSSLIFMVGNSFQHFLTNEAQADLMNSIHRHLVPGGKFIFSIRFPNADKLLIPPEEEFWRSYQDDRGRTVDVYTICRYDAISQVQHCTTIRRTKNEQGIIEKEHKTDIALRFTFPQEIQRLFAETGFDVVHTFGDWQESPLTGNSQSMVYVLKKI
ncbi:class I SAM-dependent DNA methyltransferase [Paenibacillus faecalis]|uniref:class I SAM-dependent DNA methyltransferase n=1 Tax=Paenibacillus faecalis TaxID=2079532 RepID=UPI000D108051|nr:class I SAM-dependent methyltransferase [Paenibacillus faecalis]